jgi:blocked-early-in-transport protein 1
MREIAFDLDQQLKEDNSLIDQAGSGLERVTNMMKSTLGNVNQMLATGGSKHMCYLILFIVVVFMGLYSLMK